jgi:hypothetical protein
MEVADARATLVDLSDNAAVGPLTLTVPRRHVEEALALDEPIDLVLDVSRSGGDGEPETGRIAVAWERAELEELLGRTDDESITMVFDEDELRRVLDAEFEAHGMRHTLAVLAVAVAAGGAASAAMAYPAEGTQAGDAAVAQATPGAQIEAIRSAAAIPSAPAGAAGSEAVRTAEPLPAASGTGALAASGIEGVRSAEAVAARTASAGDGGLAISLPSPESTAALLGGFAVLITGAAFVARSKRHELRLP